MLQMRGGGLSDSLRRVGPDTFVECVSGGGYVDETMRFFTNFAGVGVDAPVKSEPRESVDLNDLLVKAKGSLSNVKLE